MIIAFSVFMDKTIWSSSTTSPPKTLTFLRINVTWLAGAISFVMKIVAILHFLLVEWSQQSYHKFINCKGISILTTELALKMHGCVPLCLCLQLPPLLSLSSMLGVGCLVQHLFVVHRTPGMVCRVWTGSHHPAVWGICSWALREGQRMRNKLNTGESAQHTTMRHDLTY